jgi:hypothetical protein
LRIINGFLPRDVAMAASGSRHGTCAAEEHAWEDSQEKVFGSKKGRREAGLFNTKLVNTKLVKTKLLVGA